MQVIFDTGSTVFGVFTYKHKLPAEVKKALPGYYFSQDLRQAPVEALQVGHAHTHTHTHTQ